MEVATTNDDGSPQALRFTLTNAGNRDLEVPLPGVDCEMNRGSIHVGSKIIAGNPKGIGGGHGCGVGDSARSAGFIEEIKTSWYHLQPGEYLVFIGDARRMIDKTEGTLTYEYWAEYEPPRLTNAELRAAEAEGYLVPSAKAVSAHMTFSERWPTEE